MSPLRALSLVAAGRGGAGCSLFDRVVDVEDTVQARDGQDPLDRGGRGDQNQRPVVLLGSPKARDEDGEAARVHELNPCQVHGEIVVALLYLLDQVVPKPGGV